MTPGDRFFEAIVGGDRPGRWSARRPTAPPRCSCAAPGTRTTRSVAERLLHLADTEGIETIAEVWSGAPADSLAGCLWRLYLLRSWVYADPVGVAREFEAGRRTRPGRRGSSPGSPTRPDPSELKAMIDQVLRGIAGSDFADVLFRAAAFARVVATGRAVAGRAGGRASRMLHAGRAARRRPAGARPPAGLRRRRTGLIPA